MGTERRKIDLARAMISNPELLVMERPLHHYDRYSATMVVDCLLEYVRERGLCLPLETINQRRPRTCFFTEMADVAIARRANLVYCMSDNGSLALDMPKVPIPGASNGIG